MKETRKKAVRSLLAVALLGQACFAVANDTALQKAQLQVDINATAREVSGIERNTLLPAVSRVEVFVSLATDVEYTLRQVSLTVDGKPVATHSYTNAEIKSLRFGALHTLWQGNLPSGSHQFQATFTGVDKKDNTVQNTAGLDFDKGANSRSLELRVRRDQESGEAVFSVQDWGDAQ